MANRIMETSFVDSGQTSDLQNEQEKVENCDYEGRNPTGHNNVFMPAWGKQ